jgi:hypothetical protein
MPSMSSRQAIRLCGWAAFVGILCLPPAVPAGVELPPPSEPAGYIARLLINEVPFPGERGYVSEADTRAAMLAVLWVVESRLKHVPGGYTQPEVASVNAENAIEVITAGGEKGQCDGFYRDRAGRPVFSPRVGERIDNLLRISGQGEPGRFARLLTYGRDLAGAYVRGGIAEADRFAGLTRIGPVPVTGRAYSWMSDRDYYDPGGRFVRIPNADSGVLGGNRFFTLESR